MAKRRQVQERDDADAREQAEARRLALLEELKARELGARLPAAPEPEAAAEEAPEPVADDVSPVEPESEATTSENAEVDAD